MHDRYILNNHNGTSCTFFTKHENTCSQYQTDIKDIVVILTICPSLIFLNRGYHGYFEFLSKFWNINLNIPLSCHNKFKLVDEDDGCGHDDDDVKLQQRK